VSKLQAIVDDIININNAHKFSVILSKKYSNNRWYANDNNREC